MATRISIPALVFAKLIRYLQTKPYGEISPLLTELQSGAQTVKDDPVEDPPEEPDGS